MGLVVRAPQSVRGNIREVLEGALIDAKNTEAVRELVGSPFTSFSAQHSVFACMPCCRNCGTQCSEGTKFCSNCGASLDVTPGVGGVTISTLPRKDSGIAALIAGLGSLFLFGLGHFYVGKIGRGVVLLVVGIVLKVAILPSLFIGSGVGFGFVILVALLNLGVWVWQIYDPYILAKTYDAEVERTGKAPW